MKLLRYLSVVRAALPRLVPLMRDPHVPQWLKAGTLLGALLIVSPLDLFGDIPVLGLLDDVTLLAMLATLFVNVATKMLPRPQEQPMRIVNPATFPRSNA